MLRRTGYLLAGIAMVAGLATAARAQVDTASLVNKPAPDFTLPTIDGATVKLSDQKGKVVVMEFWRISTAKATPTLTPFVQQIAADKTLAAQGVVVWGMTAPLGQTKEQVAQYMKETNFSFTVPWDSDFKTFGKYLNHTLPATVVVGKDGTVLYASAGWDKDHVEHLKRQVLNAIDHGLNGFNGTDDDLLGNPVPAITIKTFDGKKMNLADLKGKVVLVDFWASWCPHCALELPYIQKLANDPDLAKKGLVVIAIAADIDEKEDEARAAYVKRGFTFPAGFDSDGSAAQKVNLQGVPTLFLIGRDGTVHHVFIGFDKSTGGDISSDITRAMNKALAE